MKSKYFSINGALSMGRALEYFSRVGKEGGRTLARAVAQVRESIWEAIRISYATYAPPGKGLAPPVVPSEGLVNALGI